MLLIYILQSYVFIIIIWVSRLSDTSNLLYWMSNNINTHAWFLWKIYINYRPLLLTQFNNKHLQNNRYVDTYPRPSIDKYVKNHPITIFLCSPSEFNLTIFKVLGKLYNFTKLAFGNILQNFQRENISSYNKEISFLDYIVIFSGLAQRYETLMVFKTPTNLKLLNASVFLFFFLLVCVYYSKWILNKCLFTL